VIEGGGGPPADNDYVQFLFFGILEEMGRNFAGGRGRNGQWMREGGGTWKKKSNPRISQHSGQHFSNQRRTFLGSRVKKTSKAI